MEKQTLTLPATAGTITDLAWSPDGKKLAAVTDCGWLFVWRTSTSTLQIRSHLGRTHLLTVAWEHQGQALTVGSANGALYRIERLTEPKVMTHFFEHPVTRVAWSCSPVGRCLVVSGQALTILDGRGCPPVTKQYATPILDAGWSSDGRTLAILCEDGPVEVWDTAQAVNVLTLTHIPSPRCLAWHRDGRHLSIGTAPGSIQVCDVRAKRCHPWFQVSPSPISTIKWGAHYLAVASKTTQDDFSLIDEAGFTHHQPITSAFTWHPQGNLLASGHTRSIALTTL